MSFKHSANKIAVEVTYNSSAVRDALSTRTMILFCTTSTPKLTYFKGTSTPRSVVVDMMHNTQNKK